MYYKTRLTAWSAGENEENNALNNSWGKSELVTLKCLNKNLCCTESIQRGEKHPNKNGCRKLEHKSDNKNNHKTA